MRFKFSIYTLLFLISLSHASHALAETNLPLDLIELLGEIDDDENVLEIALSELRQSTSEPQKNLGNKQSNKQDSEITIPVGGNKK